MVCEFSSVQASRLLYRRVAAEGRPLRAVWAVVERPRLVRRRGTQCVGVPGRRREADVISTPRESEAGI